LDEGYRVEVRGQTELKVREFPGPQSSVSVYSRNTSHLAMWLGRAGDIGDDLLIASVLLQF
jgi:hypothetical protein